MAPAAPFWCWHRAQLQRGYGVASGQAPDSPYPAGTIALQAPLFAAHGIDLSPYFAGTLNLGFSDTRWQLQDPDARVERLRWTELHPPETFSFWRAALRWADLEQPIPVLIYWPHPETKRNHHHSADRLEVLAPWIDDLAARQNLELGVDGRRCRRLQPQRLQARLLEALKFRVLASQAEFYRAFGLQPQRLNDASPAALEAFRAWIATVEPQACGLNAPELLAVLRSAWTLYGDERT